VTPTTAVIGVPLYNGACHLPEAIESLLCQTRRDLALVLVDDCSTDETPEVAERYVRLDRRVSYQRNEHRLGMIGNWRRTFEVARERHPSAELFAWGSDHDVWHPRWLASVQDALEQNPEAVLAYPLSRTFLEPGTSLRTSTRPFSTRGVVDPLERLRRSWWGMSAGKMVYGLFRADALARAGVFRPVLLPDRLLLAEIALQGEFEQVDEVLWYRRVNKTFSYERQRSAFFPDGSPLYSYLPWWLMHPGALGLSLVVRGSGQPTIGRAMGALCVLEAARLSIGLELIRQRHGGDKSIGRRLRVRLRSKTKYLIRRSLYRLGLSSDTGLRSDTMTGDSLSVSRGEAV
jgi:glycosyltransferase involved in cell wall biosynthesis